MIGIGINTAILIGIGRHWAMIVGVLITNYLILPLADGNIIFLQTIMLEPSVWSMTDLSTWQFRLSDVMVKCQADPNFRHNFSV